MTAEQFVKAVKANKEETLEIYFSDKETYVGNLIKDVIGYGVPKDKVHELVSSVLNENCYSLLLAIDGEAAVGNIQNSYKLFDEEGNELTGSGEIESEAYEQFME